VAFARESRGHLRCPALKLGFGEQLAGLVNGIAVVGLGEIEQADYRPHLTPVAGTRKDGPPRRPRPELGRANVGRDARTFVHAGGKKDDQVIAVRNASTVDLAAAALDDVGAAGDRVAFNTDKFNLFPEPRGNNRMYGFVLCDLSPCPPCSPSGLLVVNPPSLRHLTSPERALLVALALCLL
jgi:hypothetical protein